MAITFDVFIKRQKIYYVTGAITVVTFLALSLLAFYNPQSKTPFMPLIDALIVIASFTSVFFLLVILTGVLKTYVKAGELILADDYIIIDALEIRLNEAKNISLKISEPIRKRFGNTLNNRIELIGPNGNIHKNRFVIKSFDDNEELDKLLQQWLAQHVNFKWSYNTFNF